MSNKNTSDQNLIRYIMKGYPNMPNNKCPIRTPNLKRDDLRWNEMNDTVECSLEPENISYIITEDAFRRLPVVSSHDRQRLVDWILEQNHQSKTTPTITTNVLVSLGLSSK